MEKRTTALVIMSILAAVSTGGWVLTDNALNSCQEAKTTLSDSVAKIIPGPNPENLFNLMREAAWQAKHPCGGKISPFQVERAKPSSFPEKKWCAELKARMDKGSFEPHRTQQDVDRDEALHPMVDYAEEMMDCAMGYSGERRPIDTVKDPVTHSSWVLGGDCERLAHRLNNKERHHQDRLCKTYIDDNYGQAAKCQEEMLTFATEWCTKPDLYDTQLRRCLQHDLPTYLNDLEEKPR